jgi:putative membrane-bound dehydrogenase-like protein
MILQRRGELFPPFALVGRAFPVVNRSPKPLNTGKKTNMSMKTFFLSASLVLGLPLAGAQFQIGVLNFTVPDGFEMEQVAGPGLVERPVEADFDEQGRLYVTDSSGSNDKVDKQLEQKPHRVVRLEDTDGDGRFDKTTVFADKLMFPEGAMWYDGSFYVAAPPSIWKLTDTDGDGVADRREEWFKGKTLTGCANDLHGPYLGLDGWIYWCKGAFAQQTYERPGKSPFVTRAAHIFRRRPESDLIEPVMTGGMDNPVEVAFTATGERFFTTTFFQHPGGGQRDGLIHAIYGGVYGKPNNVLDDQKRTGDLMPVLTHLGPAAPCGLLRYESEALGKEYKDNLFSCAFNLHKVLRHELEPAGATFKSKDSDFLSSDNTDFHPTDVLEDADGSLLVVNTGGWYKLCCPTSQLYKPDVLGAIYRIRRKGVAPLEDPCGLKMKWAEVGPEDLVRRFSDKRPAVRRRTLASLSKMGEQAVPALERMVTSTGSADARTRQVESIFAEHAVNAIWALTRIPGEHARAAVRVALNYSDPSVRHAALNSISAWRDAASFHEVEQALQDKNPQIQRAAAEALGRLGKPDSVPAILMAAETLHQDRILEHSLCYALIEIANSSATRDALTHAVSGAAKRVAFIALDQMDNSDLKAEEITPLLTERDPLLRETARWIASHHSSWGEQLASWFSGELTHEGLSDSDRQQLQTLLVSLSANTAVQGVMARSATNNNLALPNRVLALRSMAQANFKEAPALCADAAQECLKAADADLLSAGIAAARSFNLKTNAFPELQEVLKEIGSNSKLPALLRFEALSALPAGNFTLSPEIFDLAVSKTAPSEPVAVRNGAALVLTKAKLSDDQLLALARTFRAAGPLEVSKLLGAYENCSDEKIGTAVIEALRGSKGAAAVSRDSVKQRFGKFPTLVQDAAMQLVESMNLDSASQRTHIDALLKELKEGDVRRGQAIFNSAKAACSSCHAIGYMGGNVGPDLTRIGQVRNERDLLEAVVYPSASFVRSYEPIIVATKSGDDYSGILRKDAPDEVVLATGPGAEVRLARNDITDMRPGSVSIMPAGLDQQLTRPELADLIAFLRATRW